MVIPSRRACAAVFLFSSAIVVPAAAQIGPLPELQITANRTPQPVARAGSAITVITAEEIARESSRNVGDLLRRVPGVTLTENGGVGATQTVRIRGGDARHTLVLIDGIRVNDPSSTGREFDFSNLVLTDVERIEVLRGPQSALYGSDAMGGVINIITKRGRGAPSAGLSTEAGRYGTRELKGGISGGNERVFYSLAGTAFETAGFSRYGYRIPRITRTYRLPLEADSAERFGLTGRIGVRLTDDIEVEAGGSLNRNRAQYDAAFLPFPDTPATSEGDLLHGYARLTAHTFDRALRNQVTVYGNETRRETRDFFYGPFGGTSETRFTGDRRGVEYQGDLQLGALGTLIVGGAIEEERAKSKRQNLSPPGPVLGTLAADRVTRSVFALHQITLADRLHLSFGGRIDDVPGVDRFVTGRTTLAYEIYETETKLRASLGTGGKAPSLFQLFSPAFGNPNLDSERSIGVDAGVDQQLFDGRVTLSATAFLNRYRNLIDFAANPGVCRFDQPFGCYFNVARAETSGFELAGSVVAIPEWLRIGVTYTFLDAVDRTTNLKLARRPENEGRLAFTFTPTPRLTIEPRLVLVGERFDGFNEAGKLPAYARLDAYADYKIDDTFSVFARAENLTNARYEEVRSYGTPGRSFYGGVRAVW